MANQVGLTSGPRLLLLDTVSSSPPVSTRRLAGKIKGRKEELRRGRGAASCNRILAQGQQAAGRTCWRKRCTVEARMEGGPLPRTTPLPDLQPGVTGGGKGRTQFLKCPLCAYAQHSTLKVAFHFIP